MGYYDIIDKLSNRVEEGMMTYIQKNTVKAKSVLSALISGDFSSLPKKDIKVLGDTKFFNKSPIKYTTSEKMVEDLYVDGVSNHTVRFVSYIKNGIPYFVLLYMNVVTRLMFGRCTIYECTEVGRYQEIVSDIKGKNVSDYRYLDRDIDGCKIVAKTFYSTLGSSYCYYMGLDDFLDDFVLDCSLQVKHKCKTFEKDMELYSITNSTLSYDASIYEFSFNLYTRKGDKDGISALYNYLDYSLSSKIMYISKEDNDFVRISFYL